MMPGLVTRWLKRGLRASAGLAIMVFALAALGAWLPSIPVLGSLGPLLIAPFGSWIVLLSLAGVVAYGLRWRRRRRRGMAVFAVLAGAAALGTGAIEARQIAAADGIAIDLARTVTLSAEPHTGAAPELVQYGHDGATPLRLVVYRPAPRAGAAAPVLVYVHGGGWGGGTPFDRAGDMRWFADRGYLVLSVEYTLSSRVRHTWNIAEPQVGCALVWTAANAARLGGDAHRLALFGESAGGNLVLDVAYGAAAGTLHPACPGALPAIAAVIAPYPVIDAVRMYRNTDMVAGPFARMMTTNYTGGTPARFPDRYAAITSLTHISGAAPPTLLFPGLADHLLPPDVANGFAARARASGVAAQVIAFPAGEHSFDQVEGSIGSQLVRNASLRFLRQHGVSPG